MQSIHDGAEIAEGKVVRFEVVRGGVVEVEVEVEVEDWMGGWARSR